MMLWIQLKTLTWMTDRGAGAALLGRGLSSWTNFTFLSCVRYTVLSSGTVQALSSKIGEILSPQYTL